MDVLASLSQHIQSHPVLSAALGLGVLAVVAMVPSHAVRSVTPSYWHSTDSLPLQTKDGRTVSLAELCKSLIPRCRLHPLLFNGHLQTIWTAFTKQSVPIYYRRWTFENTDPLYTGRFSVDFVSPPHDERGEGLPPRTVHFSEEQFRNIASDDAKPMLVMLHGLSGGSHELYLRHVLAPLVGESGGWEACVVISRGCSGTKTTSSVLYNARSTWDVRQVVKWLRETFPNRPLFGMGFSLGANIMTNVCMKKYAIVTVELLLLQNPFIFVPPISLLSFFFGCMANLLCVFSWPDSTSPKKAAGVR
jgi:predicted alpha/beta-fold hydrolase